MNKKERFEAFVSYFKEAFPEPQTELNYSNPFELVVAVVLSAQCTDVRINKVTPALFEAFPTPKHMAQGSFEEIFELIRSVSYPNNKAKHLMGLSKMIMDDFGGEVPEKHEDLIKLPGVGRKTANVVVSVLYNQPAMAVDTHVFRVSKRLGLVTQTAKSPLEVEKQLVRHIPEEYVHKAHHWLILHGRYVCLARSPKCIECKITHFCRYWEKLEA
ncbi:endonuclease III [Marinoscillum furvescens]|uniref:Endonuclease III n=1 Tax=Marinoscillum furvescens DSM 4134 TaxID=1122208 RepID=A0A3D9L2I5_MARFU|nr:endonuclease III [Marinoscillum furvescens]RED98949.1 DNA-(apurinic or apyrimidinic site) lyase /endonuclease III [Marinoscillum furvescens DSM 4134]